MTDNGDGTYTYLYTAKRPGDITINVAKYYRNNVYIEYYANTGYEGLRAHDGTNSNLNLYWGSGDVFPSHNNFLTAQIYFLLKPPTTDTYTFRFDWDDSCELYLDEEFIFFTDYNNYTSTAPKDLVQDRYYRAKIRFFEWFGTAKVYLYWSSSTFSEVSIPSTSLYAPNFLERQNLTINWPDNHQKVILDIYPEWNPCGDGIRVESEQWDDGNIQSGDGCSNSWQIEKYWQWTGGSSTSKDTWYQHFNNEKLTEEVRVVQLLTVGLTLFIMVSFFVTLIILYFI